MLTLTTHSQEIYFVDDTTLAIAKFNQMDIDKGKKASKWFEQSHLEHLSILIEPNNQIYTVFTM